MAQLAPTAQQRQPVRKRRGEARLVAYETAGPQQLVNQPSKAPARPALGANTEWSQLKLHLEARLSMLRSWRFSWAEHWQLLETYILPRRGIFINTAQPTPNTMIRGIAINEAILDPTGTIAMRKCAAGMMSGLMSPSRPWFKLKPALFDRDAANAEAQEWFEEVEDRMYTVMGRSNFYDAGAQMFEDLVTFGTGPQIIYEDDKDIIRCYVPCCGEYFISSSSAMRVEPLYRLFVLTISQIVEMFGLENCPADVQSMWQTKGGSLEVERLVAHAIEPNFPIASPSYGDIGVVKGDFTWREAYWIYGSSGERPLSMRGFKEQPHICPRWAVTSNDAYGRSVGMDTLPDIMQLQVMRKREAEGLEKLNRPPMLASKELKNEPSSILPGRVTYVDQLGPEKGMRPIYTVTPQTAEMSQLIEKLQVRIQQGFFNDLFLMLETAANKDMTAYEVAQRQQEKLQVLGPVIERLQNECLAPAIKRIFRIMERKGLLPPMPKSLQATTLGIEYIGMMALAQKATETGALERFAAGMGKMMAIKPEVNDTWDGIEWSREYAESQFLSKRIMNSPEKIAQLQKARAQQQQAANQAQMLQAAVSGAQALGNTSIAPDTALGAMVGGGGGSGAPTQQ